MVTLVGKTVADRYDVVALAGSGGMGAVYRARDRTDESIVALKVIRPGLGDSSRFAREVATLAKLDHPGVVRYLDHGFTESDEPYLAMEWLEGEDLAGRLQRGPMPLDDVVALMHALAATLGDLHDFGIVHRDIKPANLFLVNGEPARLKVLDFGVARIHADVFTATGTGIVVGTPAYMAPEQARGEKNVDARADLFATGCVLFECLTARPPFIGDGAFAVLAKVVFENPPPLRELRPDAPRALEALVARLLAKDPAQRLPNGRALATAVESAGRGDDSGTEALPLVAVTSAELRVVSVVMAGPARSSPAAETLPATNDTPAVRRATATATACGGRVAELVGGAIMASFTASGSPKDLVHGAAACALAWRRGLEPRPIAIATGRAAVVGKLPFGDAIDRVTELVAKRGVANDDGIGLDEASAGLLEGPFNLRDDGHGGRALMGENAIPSERRLLGRPMPCVGRERELDLLMSVLGECVDEPLARAVVVIAPPGTGKSRLVDEFLRTARSRAPDLRAVTTKLDSLGAGSPFAMAGGVVRQLAKIPDTATPAERHAALERAVAKRVGAKQSARIAGFLAETVGAEAPSTEPAVVAARRDPSLMAEGIRSAWLEWLEAECARAPLVLLVEDLHWGDLPSVRLVDAALDRLHERPLFVLATARPEVATAFPSLWADRGMQEIRLGTLNRRASARFVKGALEDADDETVDMLVRRAAGHPFFLEELIRAVAAGASADVLPDTVLGMLQVRLDALGDDAKRTLRAASVFGERFWEEGVRVLVPDDYGVGAVLEQLAAKEVIERQPARGDVRGAGYAFRHAIVRDAAYATLPDAERARAHASCATWLERVGETDALRLADHYERGGVAEAAAAWFVRAAEQALDGNDASASLAAVSRARACATTGPVSGQIDYVAAEATYWTGDVATAGDLAESATRQLPRGSARWFRASELLVLALGQKAQNKRVSEVALDAAAVEPASDAASACASTLARAAEQLGFSDLDAEATRVRAELVRRFPNPEDLDARAAGLIYRSRAVFAMRFEAQIDNAVRDMTTAAACFARAGATRDAVFARILSIVFSMLFVEGVDPVVSYREMAAELAPMPMKFPLVFCKVQFTIVLANLGRFAEAIELGNEVLPLLGDNVRLQFHVRTSLALSLLGLRRFEAAVAEAARASAVPAQGRLRSSAFAVHALALIEVGKFDEAERVIAEARALYRTSNGWDLHVDLVPFADGLLHRKRGDDEATRACLLEAVESLERAAGKMSPSNAERFRETAWPCRPIYALARELGVGPGSR